jgi:hypothetical protein
MDQKHAPTERSLQTPQADPGFMALSALIETVRRRTGALLA